MGINELRSKVIELEERLARVESIVLSLVEQKQQPTPTTVPKPIKKELKKKAIDKAE